MGVAARNEISKGTYKQTQSVHKLQRCFTIEGAALQVHSVTLLPCFVYLGAKRSITCRRLFLFRCLGYHQMLLPTSVAEKSCQKKKPSASTKAKVQGFFSFPLRSVKCSSVLSVHCARFFLPIFERNQLTLHFCRHKLFRMMWLAV